LIGLLSIFTVAPQPNPWLLPLALSWMALMGILWSALLARQIWKWSAGNPRTKN
jgi:hypothetical protein